jgi:2-hydroxy-3-keto-5-methylthiopentenyl-1-phosphate phosphatase
MKKLRLLSLCSGVPYHIYPLFTGIVEWERSREDEAVCYPVCSLQGKDFRL